MMSDLYGPPSEFRWRELYVTPLFEADPRKVQENIAQAEWAIVLRARQLCGMRGDNIQEEQELDDALYALRALKSTIFSRPHPSQAA